MVRYFYFFLLRFVPLSNFFFFFFNDTATTEIYTLSLHDALPISDQPSIMEIYNDAVQSTTATFDTEPQDRKSTRLNSSHGYISYAVFCLKKKKHNLIKLKTLH